MEVMKELKRIVKNESTVTKLEMLDSHLNYELNSCLNYSLSETECLKYGIERGGVISSVIAKFIKANKT
jgi:hypothetical protein